MHVVSAWTRVSGLERRSTTTCSCWPASTGSSQPATEKTEVWVFFDEDNVYVSARAWDSHPERMVENEMRRDNRNLYNNALVGMVTARISSLDSRSAMTATMPRR